MTSTRNTNKKIGESPELLSYRLEQVEHGLRDLISKFDKQDNIKRADLHDLKVTLIDTISSFNTNLQKQVDELDNRKADKSEVSDLKKLVYSVGGFLGTMFSGAFLWLLSRGQ